MRKIFIIVSIAFLFAACAEDNQLYFAKFDRSYYPMVSGDYNVYDVTEINIDAPSEVYDTLQYQLKEMIGGAYNDDLGNKAYLLLRYKRTDSTENWKISDVWSVQFVDFKLFVTEENIKYVKLHFPLSLNLTWNGNAFNTLDDLTYEVTELDQAKFIQSQILDSCVLITQEADSSLIHKNFAVEIYAKDMGLVYKEITHINSQEIEPGIPLNERITTGTIYQQSFIERNHEENYAL
jgi:hypothetical protein